MSDFFKDKKVLITGASGFIGTNILIALEKLELNIAITMPHMNLRVKGKDDLLLSKRNIKGDCYDLTHRESCRKVVEGVDIIIHCAAVTHGAKFMNENPAALVVDNTVMNTYLLDAAHRAGVKKFVFISSGTVYPDDMGDKSKFKECDLYHNWVTTVIDPPDCYFGVAHMKRYGEKLCEFYSTKVKNPMQCLIIRPSNVYGQYDDFNPDTSHVMAALIKKFVDKQNPFEVWGDGKDVRDFIYVDDFVQDVLLLTEKVAKFDIFNIGYGKGFSVNKIVEKFGVSNIKYLKGSPSTVKKRLLDTSNINEFLGERSQTYIYDGIAKTVKWYRGNKL